MEPLEKVKSVVGSGMTAYEIEKKTGVTRPTIINMQKGSYDFSKASYQTVEKLANFYDQQRESTLVFKDQGGFLNFSSLLDRKLKEVIDSNNLLLDPSDKAMKEILNKIRDNVLKDSYLLEDLYDVYVEQLNKANN